MHTIRGILFVNPMVLVTPLAIFAAILLVGWLARRVVLRALRAWNSRTGSHVGLILAEALRGPILIWTLILGAHLAMQFSDLPDRYTALGAKALLVLWIVSLTIMSVRLAGNLVRNYGGQVPGALPV